MTTQTTVAAWTNEYEIPTGERNGWQTVRTYQFDRCERPFLYTISGPEPVAVEIVDPQAELRRDEEGYLRLYVPRGTVVRGMDMIDVLDLDEALAAGLARIVAAQ